MRSAEAVQESDVAERVCQHCCVPWTPGSTQKEEPERSAVCTDCRDRFGVILRGDCAAAQAPAASGPCRLATRSSAGTPRRSKPCRSTSPVQFEPVLPFGCHPQDLVPFLTRPNPLPGTQVQEPARVHALHMGACARPGVFRGRLRQATASRVLLDIPHCSHQMVHSEDATVETALPQVSGRAALRLKVVGVPALRPAERRGQSGFIAGRRDPMHVVGHEAVAQNCDTTRPRIRFHQIQIDVPILITVEHHAPMVSSPCDVVGIGSDNDSSVARHPLSSRGPAADSLRNVQLLTIPITPLGVLDCRVSAKGCGTRSDIVQLLTVPISHFLREGRRAAVSGASREG